MNIVQMCGFSTVYFLLESSLGFALILILVLLPGPLAYYKSLVDQGKLKHDSYQEKVAFELNNLLGRLDQYERDMEEYHVGFIFEMMLVFFSINYVHVLLYVYFVLFHRKTSLNGMRTGKMNGGGLCWRKPRQNNREMLRCL